MDADDESSTQCTQPTDSSQLDPRRMGRNNSGLSDQDVGDVIVVLHPCTPAAFELVQQTARRTPQHVLQHIHKADYQEQEDAVDVDEQETFIIDGKRGQTQALDLAFRFSSKLVKPHLGFGFGRNSAMSDIPVASDVHKRVSNLHFVIYINESGVVMLEDMSTNGTMVDDFLLKAKSHSKTRMLDNGTTVQILSPSPREALKFIVRIPSRQGHVDDFQRNFEMYMRRHAEAREAYYREHGMDVDALPKAHGRAGSSSVKAPLIRNAFGMHWNGGDTYNVVGTVGQGAFASVYQLATKIDGQIYAAKELEKRRFMKNGVLDRKLENEMHIMQSIDHPSIVQYHEYMDVANHLYIIMEFVPCGDLQQHLTEHGALPEVTAKQMALQVLDALDYLHIKKITHRDIKPDNILIASREQDNFIIKLSDFGLSKVVKDNDTFLKTFCGTLLYCAPEVFPHYDAHVGKGTKRPRKTPQQQNKFRSYSQAVDIWSFGAVLWYSLCVKPPFEGVADNTGRGMFDKIMMTPLDIADLVKKGVSDVAVALMVSMLNTDPMSRPSPADCLRNPWFADQQPIVRPQALALNDIAEEVENDRDIVGGPDVAGLSLDEHSSSHYSEVSLNDSDLKFFDPRQSKRFKTNDYQDHEELNLINSSPELFESIPIMHDTASPHAIPPNPQKAPKLFGEISQSDLQSPAFGRRVGNAVGQQVPSNGSENREYSQHAQRTSANRSEMSPSLLGAEAMVREMNMESAFPSDSDNGEDGGPKTPPSFESLERQSNGSQDPALLNPNETPRPVAPFSRRVDIGIPASLFYVPNDPRTHNIEYASKVSGHDFATEPVYRRKDVSLPTTMSHSNGSEASESSISLSTIEALASAAPINRSPKLLGRLVSTPDSFAKITIDLDRRNNHWGRQLENTHVYPDKDDTRVPKTAFAIYFHARGIEQVQNDEDVRHMSGLYTGIITYARNGVRINGVQLTPTDRATGEGSWGVLQTGDEIEVWSAVKGGKGCLKFRVEIYYGEGRKKRSKKGLKFHVVANSMREEQKMDEAHAIGGAGEDDDDDLYA